jgi:hypothetical protein
MKKDIILIILLIVSVTINAKDQFNPEKYRTKIEQFITIEAGLTPTESSEFFPLYDEMMRKQRALFIEKKRMSHYDPKDENECLKAINKYDELEIQIKELQRSYHIKFLKVISAKKLYNVIKAEFVFNRKMFKDMTFRK